MIQYMIYLSLSIISFMFMQMNHPLSMGLILLIQTLLISLFLGLISPSFWFSYILFLVFLGGMLVLFIYICSLASNEKFNISFSWMMFNLFIFSVLMSKYMILDFMDFMPTFYNNEMNLFMNNLLYNENIMQLNKMYNYPSNFITSLLMIYLLISLIAMIKITNIFNGPLRKSFN